MLCILFRELHSAVPPHHLGSFFFFPQNFMVKGLVGKERKKWCELYMIQWFFITKMLTGLPWWHSGKESTCQCRGHGFEPWSGKIPHATEQLSLCATTTEACAPRSCAPQQEKSLQWEARAPQWRVAPRAATRESPHAAMKTQSSQK